MKKIFLYFVILISTLGFLTLENVSADCTYKSENSLSWSVADCFENWQSSVVKVDDATIEKGFKSMITNWIDNIALILWLMAVGSLIYGALSMTLSTGDDEKIKKSKDIVKWSLIWFIWILSATTIVTLVINFMYDIWAKI